MEYKQLGSSDLKISRVSFGCMSLKLDAKDNEAILHKALAEGINYFDTADLYDKGANEELVGRALKGRRGDVIIATKAGNQWRPDGSGWDWNPRKEYILDCVEKSLQRLQTDYIDLYQMHGGTMDDPIDESIEAFEILQQQGKIRYYGLSSIRPNVIREWIRRSNIISVMTQYSLLDRRPEEATLQLLQEHNIGVLARGSVAQGLLADKPAKDILDYSAAEVERAKEAVHRLTTGQRNAAQVALQYVLHHPALTSAVVGIRTMQQLEEAVGAIDTKLTEGEVEQLRSVLKGNVYKEHR